MTTFRSGLRLVAVSAAVVLGLGSVSASGDTAADETLRLHLGTDGTYFQYSNNGDPNTQPIVPSNNCKIRVTGPLAALSATRGGPGFKDGSIGVSSGPQGVPCSRVEVSEELTLTLGDVPDAVEAALDLELKGDADIEITATRDGTTVGTFWVRSGGGIVPGEGTEGSTTAPYTATATAAAPIANCREGSDSGPDAGPDDNCYVTVIPSSSFDAITFTSLSGEMSLEGGGDYGPGSTFDTVFTLEAGYDGELGCETDNNTVTIEEGTVYGQITRLVNTDGSACVLKPYNLSVDTTASTLSFVPHDTQVPAQLAAYEATLKFAPEASANPIPSMLEYDQDDDGTTHDFEPMPWCSADPYLTPDQTGSIDTSVIPTGHTWCIVGASTELAGVDQVRTTWDVVGVGDPKFR